MAEDHSTSCSAIRGPSLDLRRQDKTVVSNAMPLDQDVLKRTALPPQLPPPPEIEGFLKKLKRKTSNISGSWNKRWFFVDPKRREFGYAKTKATAPQSSIYLNDITAVLQFDETHFQVESRTRNFFLCGESKASTSCWVKSLDEYRKKMLEYEKEHAKYTALQASAVSALTAQLQEAASSKSNNKREISQRKTNGDDPSRDSFSSSSSASSSSSSSSKRASTRTAEHQARTEKRTPSPVPLKAREQEQVTRLDRAAKPDRERTRERERERERESDRQRDTTRESRTRGREDRDRDADRDRDRVRGAKAGASRSGARGSESYNIRQHPSQGYVMQAWVDEDI